MSELTKRLRHGDWKRVAAFFQDLSESERQPFAGEVIAWCRLLALNQRAGYSKSAEKELAGQEQLKNYFELLPAAHTAAAACASLAQIKSVNDASFAPPEALVLVFGRRRPPWLDEYLETRMNREISGWSTGHHWRTARALIRAGLGRPPRHANYALGALEGIWPPFDRTKPTPLLLDLLLAEGDWLETGFWHLFEFDGNGEVSLANAEKYRKGRQTWTEALCELSGRGVLNRDRLLDASLEALSRDFIQFRAGWFSRFHEALHPSPAERAQRMGNYLNLLGSSIPPTVAFAMEAILIADKEQPLPAAKLVPGLAPALSARGKAVVKSALELLDRVAQREPKSKADVSLALVPSLLNEAPEVQKKALDLLDQHGDRQNTELLARVADVADAVAASLRSRLNWVEGSAPAVSIPTCDPLDSGVTSCTDPSRAIQPVPHLDDLLHLAARVLEDTENPNELERLLDGLSRLCAGLPDDFARRAGPLRKRAFKLASGHTSSVTYGVARLLLHWIDGEPPERSDLAQLGDGQNQFSFLFRRLEMLSDQVARRVARPLLSAPTHFGGWIEPAALVERWRLWQEAGATPDLHEQVLGLLRLAPEGRKPASKAAKVLKGEAGDAVRFALGADGRTGRDTALWLAAWRSRQPFGDLPEFERVHPKLGPDAGSAARYSWKAYSKRNQSRDHQWVTLELELDREPDLPRRIPDAALPLLFHGEWKTNEESARDLLRWSTTLWPANLEAFFARGATRLEISVDYSDVMDREFYPYLEPIAESSTELRPMACLALALGLAVQDSALRGHAQDALIAAISHDRLRSGSLGPTMSRLLDTGTNKFARWGKSLGQVARVSRAHSTGVSVLLQQTLQGDPARAPRDISALLELLVELLSETRTPLTDPATRHYLAGLSASGKTARLVKHLLT